MYTMDFLSEINNVILSYLNSFRDCWGGGGLLTSPPPDC